MPITASAIAEGAEHWPQSIQKVVLVLQDFYREKNLINMMMFPDPAECSWKFLDIIRGWPSLKVSTGSTLGQLDSLFRGLLKNSRLTHYWVTGYLKFAVECLMLERPSSLIATALWQYLAVLISIFEKHLAQPSPATEADNHILKEAAIILFGRVACHLDPMDPCIPTIVDRLVEALKTPVDLMDDDLLNSPKYATRHGAAYGPAGVLKGTGISGVKEFNIIPRLTYCNGGQEMIRTTSGCHVCVQDTIDYTWTTFRIPYNLRPSTSSVLVWGQSTADIREATQGAVRVNMGNLSGYGVKLILPSLLEGLDEKQWQTKKVPVDPVPEARATAANALGTLAERLREINFPDLMPNLLQTLKTDTSGVDRQGAAQGLSEVLSGLEMERLEGLLPDIIANAQ
ncbi:hypothetical protein DXG01_006073 [Tephrocybe rancida]|nr:hypothetical protein DXG01_006073 [Tephrocybe rancida]